MLEAAQRGPRFTISLKRSTPNLQLSTSRPITHLSGVKERIRNAASTSALTQKALLEPAEERETAVIDHLSQGRE